MKTQKLTKAALIRLLEEEITWCKEHLDQPEEFRYGYLAGLQQAKRLIKKIPLTKKEALL